ncbi:MAG: hypothetical protein NVSMB24_06000 [Mucilaginibacter sp.]
MKHNKNIEQRTFLQDRFEILIKKQQAGTATFLELTELDDIVNRHAAIRETILQEMREADGPPDTPAEKDVGFAAKKQTGSLFSRLKSFFAGWLQFHHSRNSFHYAMY